MEAKAGELLADRPELRVVLLADTDGLAVDQHDPPADGGAEPSSVLLRRLS